MIHAIHKKDIRRTPAYMVEWRDATCDSGWWNSLPDNRDPKGLTTRVTTMGYLMRKTPREITLAMSVSINGHAGELLTIPRAWIEGMHRIKKRK